MSSLSREIFIGKRTHTDSAYPRDVRCRRNTLSLTPLRSTFNVFVSLQIFLSNLRLFAAPNIREPCRQYIVSGHHPVSAFLFTQESGEPPPTNASRSKLHKRAFIAFITNQNKLSIQVMHLLPLSFFHFLL